MAYWQSSQPRPDWLDDMEWRWAQEGEVSKLLDTPFGLDIFTQEIDKFLL
jgi:hypothetical protein